MLKSTLTRLQCPACSGRLVLYPIKAAGVEITSGTLCCEACEAVFPILAGVAILVEDVGQYLVSHVKGIAQFVPDAEIPDEYATDYLEAKSELAPEHIEEDLEAERVIALYLMNHYLSVKPAPGSESNWWRPLVGAASPLIDRLMQEHWDSGPLAKITEWTAELAAKEPIDAVIELGCGVGGLARMLRPHTKFYLGIDSSFASIALGRHLALGVPYARPIRIPNDLLMGQLSRAVRVPVVKSPNESVDLVVGDLERMPVVAGNYDVSLALNAIDMLNEPEILPQYQNSLLKPGGVAIQSCPYIWHEEVASRLRERLPKDIQDSARAVEWLYEEEGFKVEKKIEHLPWLFLKHVRQLEIYSVHLFQARKGS